MSGILDKISFLWKLDYLSVIRRRPFRILGSGLLAGVLASLAVNDSRAPNYPQNGGSASEAKRVDTLGTAPAQETQQHFPWLICEATLAGLVVGLFWAFLSEAKHNSSRMEAELARLTGVPVWASLPPIQDEKSDPAKNRKR